MNRFTRLMLRGVVAVTLVGTATACSNFPFLGRNQSANQTEDSPGTTQVQRTNRTRTQRANQPSTQAQNNNQTTAQAPDATVNPEGAGNTQSDQTDSDQAVPALW